MCEHKIEDTIIEFVGAHARTHIRHKHIESLCSETAGLAHSFEVDGAMQANAAVALWLVQRVERGHICFSIRKSLFQFSET